MKLGLFDDNLIEADGGKDQRQCRDNNGHHAAAALHRLAGDLAILIIGLGAGLPAVPFAHRDFPPTTTDGGHHMGGLCPLVT